MNCEKRKTLVLGIIISLLLFNLISVDWVKADTVTVTFSGITNPSSTHKAYYYNDDNGAGNGDWGGAGTELTDANYLKTVVLDGNLSTVSQTGAKYAFTRYEFNISYVLNANGITPSDVTQVYIRWDGYGYSPSTTTYGAYSAIQKQSDGTWKEYAVGDLVGVTGTWSHASSSASALSLTIAEANVSDFLNNGLNYMLKYTVRSAGTTITGETKSLHCDRIYATITYTPSLTAPTLVSPTNGGTGYTITPNFDWNVSTGGTSPYTYELMVDTDLAFGSPDINATGISDSNYSYTTGLTPGTTYYWKVRTLDAGSAYSDWTSTYAFTTAPFVAPTFTMPTSGMSITTATPTFSWSASTGGSGTYTYELMVSLNSGFTTTVVNQTGIATTSYAMTSNLTPDVHYAKLRALDDLGNYSDWTSTISFTAVAPSSGGASSSTSTQEEYVPYTAPVTTNNDTVTTTSSSSTNVFTKYVVNPVKVVFINPLRALWNWFTGLFRFSGQDEIIDIMEMPVGVNGYNVPLYIIVGGAVILIFAFGDGIKMPKFKIGKKKRRKR